MTDFSKYNKFASIIDTKYKFFYLDKIIMLCDFILKHKKKSIKALRQIEPKNAFFQWYDACNKKTLEQFCFDLYNASLSIIFAETCQLIF